LRTTVVQAFARTLVDDSRRPADVTATFGEASSGPPTDRDLPGIGDVVGGHYELIAVLGEGMFGKVYVAQRLDVPEHRVALKILPRSLYVGRNVERELVMLATVGHPHVVQLKDHGTTPDYVWLTMPVYQGETLAERLARKGTLSVKQAYDIFLPVARGLEALHAGGLRHQDVKPENIFLAVFGGRVHPIVLDLGVAAEKDASFVAGTAIFAAPEQVAALAGLPAAATFSEKMDVYGLAATLLAALVGPKLYPGDDAADRAALAAAQEVRTTDPLGFRALPEVTGKARDNLAAALCRWLAFLPDDRPDMKRLCEELDVLLDQEREEERLEAERRTQQKVSVVRMRIAVGALLLAGAAGGVVAYQKRETLRVAGELAEARREGAKSFDKLDTCVASHTMATKESAACKAALELERGELKRSLDEVMRSGSQTEAEHAREVSRHNARIKALEDSMVAAKRSCDDSLTRLITDGSRARLELSAERDAARQKAEAEHVERVAAEAVRDACRADRATCTEERDTCKGALAAAKAAAVVKAPSAAPSGDPAPEAKPLPAPVLPVPATPAPVPP
jgi:serine/threonine protein kinase